MLRKLFAFASLSCAGPLVLSAQTSIQNLTVDSAQESSIPSAGAAPVMEFRAASRTISRLPDAPSPSTRNQLHGRAYGWDGAVPMGAPDVTLHSELPMTEFGGSLGWNTFFASYDQVGFSQAKLFSFLTSVRAQGGDSALPVGINPTSFSAFAAGVDHRFGSRDSAYARFGRQALGSYSLRPDESGKPSGMATDFGIKQQSAIVGNSVMVSPATADETRAQFITNDTQLPAEALMTGMQSALPTMRQDRIFRAANDVFTQVGGQKLRMGGDFIYNQMNISFIESGLGRAAAGNSLMHQSSRSADMYAQSVKKIRSNLLLTSGITYDVQAMPGFKTDTNNVAPQIGVAWAPTARTVIRGGAGIYYDQIPVPSIAGPLDPNGTTNIQASARFVSRNGLAVPQLASFITLSPTIQNSYAEQANLQIEQQIGAKSFLSVQTEHVRGVQLALPVSHTVGLCASASACRAGNTFWGQEIGTGSTSSYTGTSVAFTQQPVHWGSFKVSYTYATAQGAGTGENSSQIADQMRRASLTGVLHTSTEPGSDLWQHFANGFVLTGTGDYANRSEFAGIDLFNFNARLTKTLVWGKRYRLDAQAQTFNALQRTTAAFARSAAQMGDSAAMIFSTYQRVAALQSPNGSQVGLRLDF